MTLLKIILMTVGIAFLVFGYLIYFKGKYNLINNFESDFKAGRKTGAYARKVGLVELILGTLLVLIAIFLIIS